MPESTFPRVDSNSDPLPPWKTDSSRHCIETPNDVHAGEIETSTSLAIRPTLVRMDRLQMEVPAFTSRYLDFTSKRGVSWYAHTHKISASGVMGDPTKASVEKGEKMWELIIAPLIIFVDQLKTLTLKEIYQRKH